MRKWQFVRVMRELGYTDDFIGKILALRQKEQNKGIRRSWKEYIPEYIREKPAHKRPQKQGGNR